MSLNAFYIFAREYKGPVRLGLIRRHGYAKVFKIGEILISKDYLLHLETREDLRNLLKRMLEEHRRFFPASTSGCQ